MIRKLKYWLLLTASLQTGIVLAQPNSNIATSYPIDQNFSTGNNIYNVDLYSGKLNLSVPIYSYSAENTPLKFNVNLDYDGGGNKVNTVASQVGLNWHLDFGGSLSREIVGMPDELADGGFRSTPPVPTSPDFFPGTTPPLSTLRNSADNRLDTELDVFTFRAGRYSGRFYIGKNGSIKMQKENNVKVTMLAPSNAALTGGRDSVRSHTFIITIPDGTEYHYTLYNCEKINYFNNNFIARPVFYASTKWYLTKIRHPFTNQEITLEYKLSEPSIYLVPTGQDLTYQIMRSGYQNTESFCGQCENEACDEVSIKFEYHFMRVYEIKNISLPNGDKVAFEYNQYRPDQNDNSLDKIKVTNSYSDKTITYRLSHVVTNREAGGNSEQTYLQKGTQAYNNLAYEVGMNYYGLANKYSILLNKITRVDEATNSELPGYEFEYNPTTLPPVGATKGVDLWGFYCKSGSLNNVSQNVSIYDYDNRFPILNYCQAKTLQKIKLPTGQSISFNFELNTIEGLPNQGQGYPQNLDNLYYISGLRVRQVSQKDDLLNTPAKIIKSYKYTKADGTSSGILPSVPYMDFLYQEGLYSTNYYSASVKACPMFDAYAHYWNWYDFPWNQNQVFSFHARSKTSLNKQRTAHGGTTEYARVEEYEGTFSNFLNKRIYSFTTMKDYGGGPEYNELPYKPFPDYEFKRGLLKEIQTYNKANILTKKVVNEYEIRENSIAGAHFNSLKVAFVRSGLSTSSTADFRMSTYFPVSGISLLNKSTTTTYFDNNRYTEDIVNYTYDYSYNLLANISSKNEKEEQIEQRFYYPFNYNIPGPINTLTSNRILSTPLVVENWNLSKNILLSSVTNTVKYVGASGSNNIRLEKSFVLTPTSEINAQTWGLLNQNQLLKLPLQHTEIKHNVHYDIYGNTLEEKVKGITKSYVYANNGSQLVAEVLNAEAADIAYTSFEENLQPSGLGGWTVAGQQVLISPQNKLGGKSALTAVVIGLVTKNNLNPSKNYIVSFWSKGNVTPVVTIAGNVVIPIEASETAQGWTLYKCKVTGSTQVSVRIASHTSLDELRLYPDGAIMTTKCYDALWKVPLIECSADNRFVSYEYDVFGRLKFRKDMDGNITNVIEHAPQETQN